MHLPHSIYLYSILLTLPTQSTMHLSHSIYLYSTLLTLPTKSTMHISHSIYIYISTLLTLPTKSTMHLSHSIYLYPTPPAYKVNYASTPLYISLPHPLCLQSQLCIYPTLYISTPPTLPMNSTFYLSPFISILLLNTYKVN